MSGRAVVYWGWLLVALVVGAMPLFPGSADSTAADTQFSASRAFEHVEIVADAPRPIGTAANRKARRYISDTLERLGLESELQISDASDYYGGTDRDIAVVNVIARVAGTASTGAIVLVGHYDTFPATAGANDDASAVAVMLESARAILARESLRNDVILLFTDGEEPAPRFGSSAFVAGRRWVGDIRFVINLEAIGTTGASLLIDQSGPDRWVIDQYAAAVPHPAAFSFLTALIDLIGGSNTDFSPFRDRGIAGVDTAYTHGSTIYHSPADTPDRVSLGSLQHHGDNALALTSHIGNLDLSVPQDGSEVVFFTVGRSVVVRYPAAWALPVAFLAGLLVALDVHRRRAWSASARTAAVVFGTTVGSGIVSAVVWTGIGGWRGDMGITESYAHLVGLAVLTTCVAAAFLRLQQRWTHPGRDAAGVVVAWSLLAIVTAGLVPKMSSLFTWPAVAGAVVLVLARCRPNVVWLRDAAAALAMSITIVLCVPAVDLMYQFAQPRPGNPDSQVLSAVAIPVMLMALAMQLVHVFRPAPSIVPVSSRSSTVAEDESVR